MSAPFILAIAGLPASAPSRNCIVEPVENAYGFGIPFGRYIVRTLVPTPAWRFFVLGNIGLDLRESALSRHCIVEQAGKTHVRLEVDSGTREYGLQFQIHDGDALLPGSTWLPRARAPAPLFSGTWGGVVAISGGHLIVAAVAKQTWRPTCVYAYVCTYIYVYIMCVRAAAQDSSRALSRVCGAEKQNAC